MTGNNFKIFGVRPSETQNQVWIAYMLNKQVLIETGIITGDQDGFLT
jgi:hypothetical protein